MSVPAPADLVYEWCSDLIVRGHHARVRTQCTTHLQLVRKKPVRGLWRWTSVTYRDPDGLPSYAESDFQPDRASASAAHDAVVTMLCAPRVSVMEVLPPTPQSVQPTQSQEMSRDQTA